MRPRYGSGDGVRVRAGRSVVQGAESRVVIDPAPETPDRALICEAAECLPYRLMAGEVEKVLWGKDATPAIAVNPTKYFCCYILGHSRCL